MAESVQRELGEHDVRLSSIERDVGEMKPQVNAIALWVAKQEALSERQASSKANYTAPMISGVVAALMGSLSAWITTRW